MLAIIPARSGSKRIPNKNFLKVNGRPFVLEAVDKLSSLGIFDQIILSLDNHDNDEEFNQVEVNLHYRPERLANDDTPTLDVVRDVIQSIEAKDCEEICCVYACTPLLQKRRLLEGLDLLKTNPESYIFAAQLSPVNPWRTFNLIREKISFVSHEALDIPTQNHRRYFLDAGQFYWAKSSTWLTRDRILSDDSVPVLLNKWETIDIDEVEDLEIALALKRTREQRHYNE